MHQVATLTRWCRYDDSAMSRLGAVTLPLVSVLVCAVSLGCSDAPRAGFAELDERPAKQVPREASKCEVGEQRECGITIKQSEDLVSCFKGVKECQEDGSWSDCIDAELDVESELEQDDVLAFSGRT